MNRFYYFSLLILSMVGRTAFGQTVAIVEVPPLEKPDFPILGEQLGNDLKSLIEDDPYDVRKEMLNVSALHQLDSLLESGNGLLPDNPEALGELRDLNWDYSRDGKTHINRVSDAFEDIKDKGVTATKNGAISTKRLMGRLRKPDPEPMHSPDNLAEMPQRSFAPSLSRPKVREQLLDRGENLKQFDLREKKGILPRNALWENLIGMAQNRHTALNLSSNIALPLGKRGRAGTGLTFHYQKTEEERPASVLAYRLFGEYAVLKKALALRAELSSLFPKVSYMGSSEAVRPKKTQHETLLGLVYTRPIRGLLSMDLSLLYNTGSKPGPLSLYGPLVIRAAFKIIK